MHTNEIPTVFKPTEKNISPRLQWLLTANQRDYERQQLCRTACEEQAAALLRRPLDYPQAFARFGLLLGTFPPAALFGRAWYQLAANGDNNSPLLWCLVGAMNLLCAWVGYLMGRHAGVFAAKLRDTHWLKALPAYALIGFYWAAVTGAAGGALFFGFGALFGPFFALPVGLLAFMLFAPLYRLLENGGMMESRQFWPLASGIAMTLAALILGI